MRALRRGRGPRRWCKNRASLHSTDLFQAQLAIELLGNPVALAGGVLKFLAVHNLHCATGVLDELLPLQNTSCQAHGRPICPSAETLRLVKNARIGFKRALMPFVKKQREAREDELTAAADADHKKLPPISGSQLQADQLEVSALVERGSLVRNLR